MFLTRNLRREDGGSRHRSSVHPCYLDQRERSPHSAVYMTQAVLILMCIPSIFPTWRSTLIAAGVIYALLIIAFFWLLRQVDTMATGEGPAFFGAVMLFGVATCILVSSCLAKLILAFVLSRIRPGFALWSRRVIFGAGVCIAVVLAGAVLGAFINREFAFLVGSASIWLSLVTWLMPINSFKQNGRPSV